MTDLVIQLRFTEAWEALNAVEQRLEILALHAERFPDSDEIVAAMGRLISAKDRIREAMSLTDRMTAEAIVASITPGPQDVPLANADDWMLAYQRGDLS